MRVALFRSKHSTINSEAERKEQSKKISALRVFNLLVYSVISVYWHTFSFCLCPILRFTIFFSYYFIYFSSLLPIASYCMWLHVVCTWLLSPFWIYLSCTISAASRCIEVIDRSCTSIMSNLVFPKEEYSCHVHTIWIASCSEEENNGSVFIVKIKHLVVNRCGDISLIFWECRCLINKKTVRLL